MYFQARLFGVRYRLCNLVRVAVFDVGCQRVLLNFDVLFADFGFMDEVFLDLLDCGRQLLVTVCKVKLGYPIPLRLYVPSGRLAGPTENPFFCLLAGCSSCLGGFLSSLGIV